MHCRRLVLAFVCLVAVGIADSEARAQTGSSSGGTTGSSSDSINMASGLTNPYRFLCPSGQTTCNPTSQIDQTNNPRPQNLNPTGCNFTDCEQDLRLDFKLVISGFNGDHVEVWAGNTDCTQDTNRSQITTSTSHPCWPVAGSTGPLYAVSTSPLSYSVFARDVLRFSPPPQQGVQQQWNGTFHNSSQGPTACQVQTSDAAAAFSLYFIPVNSVFQAQGTAYQWPLNTDLVGPPPPPSVSLQQGDTLLQVSWTSPGDDPDIAGFAIWSDPPAGGATSGGCSCGGSPGTGANSYVGGDALAVTADATQYRCIDATSPSDAVVEGATDAPGVTMETGAAEASMMEGAAPEASMPMPEASTDGAPEAAASEGGTGSSSGSSSGDSGAGDAGDAGMVNCNPVNVGGGGGSCSSPALTGGSFVVGGSSSTSTEAGTVLTDDAGNPIGSDGGMALSGGGIASIDPKYKAYELDDKVPSPISLTGLTNGHSYAVVVTSIDNFGNVGPVSTPQCGQPEPTSDFWKTYKTDNGSAAGCALEAGDGSSSDLPLFAFGLAVTGAAFMRRRRTRR
jgi:hypothetical protein